MTEKRTAAAIRKRVTNQAKRRHEKWAREMQTWGWKLEAPAEYIAPEAK